MRKISFTLMTIFILLVLYGCAESQVDSQFSGASSDNQNPVIENYDTVLPSIMYNGQIYVKTRETQIGIKFSQIVGRITSVVSESEWPSENFQANFDSSGSVIAVADEAVFLSEYGRWIRFDEYETYLSNIEAAAIVANEADACAEEIGLIMFVEDADPTGAVVAFWQSGIEIGGLLSVDEEYLIQEKDSSGKWVDIDITEDPIWNHIGYTIPLDGVGRICIEWADIYGGLKSGEYRIREYVTEISTGTGQEYKDPTTYILNAEFSLPFELNLKYIWYGTRYYPIYYGNRYWQNPDYKFDMFELIDINNPPQDLLQTMSSDELAELLFVNPYLGQITTYYGEDGRYDYSTYFGFMEFNSDIFCELLRREDGIISILNRYQNSGIDEQWFEDEKCTDSLEGLIIWWSELMGSQFINLYSEVFTEKETDLAKQIIIDKNSVYSEIPDVYRNDLEFVSDIEYHSGNVAGVPRNLFKVR